MHLLKVSTALACGLPLLAQVQADVPPVDGFKITWSDDFNGDAGSPPNADNWIIDTGTSYPGGPDHWGTGEVQTYTKNAENLQLNGKGALVITPVKDDSGGGGWTSARIETSRSNFGAAGGGKMRLQASVSMPDVTGDPAAGYWPAFWALGAPYRDNYQNWPSIGEFDIMENVNGVNKVWGVMHCDKSPGGACDEPDGVGSDTACPGSTCQGNFHTYAVEVDRSTSPETMKWTVDGEQFHSVTQDQLGADVWKKAVQGDVFLLLNVAMGGAFPDGIAGSETPTDATVSGKSMQVDYVAVYNT